VSGALDLGLLLGASGLAWWVSERARLHREAVARCPGHEYDYVSVYDEGRMWVAMCRLCPHQEPVTDEARAGELTARYVRERGGHPPRIRGPFW